MKKDLVIIIAGQTNTGKSTAARVIQATLGSLGMTAELNENEEVVPNSQLKAADKILGGRKVTIMTEILKPNVKITGIELVDYQTKTLHEVSLFLSRIDKFSQEEYNNLVSNVHKALNG